MKVQRKKASGSYFSDLYAGLFFKPQILSGYSFGSLRAVTVFVLLFHVHIAELGNKNFTSSAHMWSPF